MGTHIALDLASPQFRSKVLGCWMGKNCGGTLGAPLELIIGRAEPFDVWWYPELRTGGIPNDDLEIQLVWLKALEEVGPHLRSADLARYWLDHICYNFDEYGMHKTNLRLGLRPPVSGIYNNWFRDCMGSPIRSEIWACVTPGVPQLAARYAFEDATCDHAGGEGVFGEIFNAVIESAAFVVSDRDPLLDIGLSYIPEESMIARAVQTVRRAHAEQVDWLEARQRILRATPHYVAQYAPINLGFQVLGWLYGNDFGDALCKTVNCGYDTDCTGATLGSILGIIAGQEGLPERWTAPLGESISTNESWGGLAHISDGANPVPTNLAELTDRVCAQAERVLQAHGKLSAAGTLCIDPASLYATKEIRSLWEARPWTISYPGQTFEVQVEYPATPVGIPGTTTTLRTVINNPHPQPLQVSCELQAPAGWELTEPTRVLVVPPVGAGALNWEVPVPRPALLHNSNLLLLNAQAQERPAQPATPIVLIGAHKYRYSGPYMREGLSDLALLQEPFAPETLDGTPLEPQSRAGTWHERYAQDYALPFADLLTAAGALYIQTYLYAEKAQNVWLGVMASCLRTVWVNNIQVASVSSYRHFRPTPLSDQEEGFAHVHLEQGWNEVLIKCVRSADAPDFAAHLLLSTDDRLHHGLPAITRTRFPGDV